MEKLTGTKEIEYRGQIELYAVYDGWREMFVGYVHTCKQRPVPPPEHPALKAERDALYGVQ